MLVWSCGMLGNRIIVRHKEIEFLFCMSDCQLFRAYMEIPILQPLFWFIYAFLSVIGIVFWQCSSGEWTDLSLKWLFKALKETEKL